MAHPRTPQQASAPPATTALAAARASSPGWRDPRLWIGVALVAASVVGGARLLASADDSVAVWAVSSDLGAGAAVGQGDLTAHRVRFGDETDLARYYLVGATLPDDMELSRAVDSGELLPRGAVGSAVDSNTVQVSVAVDSDQVPPSVDAGSVVDLYLLTPAPVGGPPDDGGGDGVRPVLGEVTVLSAPDAAGGFGSTGTRQLVLGVSQAQARRYFGLVASIDDPLLTVVRRS